jgi:hypothetical protein
MKRSGLALLVGFALSNAAGAAPAPLAFVELAQAQR